jgi:hypothetical protein
MARFYTEAGAPTGIDHHPESRPVYPGDPTPGFHDEGGALTLQGLNLVNGFTPGLDQMDLHTPPPASLNGIKGDFSFRVEPRLTGFVEPDGGVRIASSAQSRSGWHTLSRLEGLPIWHAIERCHFDQTVCLDDSDKACGADISPPQTGAHSNQEEGNPGYK